MSSRLRLPLVFAFALLFTGGTLRGVQAQETRTLVIEDGTVYLDGRRVPGDELPPSLDVSNLNARYSFSGIAKPVVELNGALYAIGDSLTPVDPSAVSARQSVVFLQGGNRAAQNSRADASPSASQLQQFQAQYLQEIQQRHKQLYARLMRERQMEAETYELARLIRQLPTGSERQQYIDSLRSTLNDIFELKQENRRREIQQLEGQLEELRRGLEERERVRGRMVEQRIQQLVGSVGNPQ